MSEKEWIAKIKSSLKICVSVDFKQARARGVYGGTRLVRALIGSCSHFVGNSTGRPNQVGSHQQNIARAAILCKNGNCWSVRYGS